MAVSLAKFMGGTRRYTSNAVLFAGHQRLVVLDGTSLQCALPDARRLRKGTPVFLVVNVNASSATVKTNGGATLLTLLQNEGVKLGLNDNSTAAGGWSKFMRNVNSAGAFSMVAGAPVIGTLRADCKPAGFMLIQCDDQKNVIYTDDPTLAAQAGKVVKIGTKCWRVYTARLSGKHPQKLSAWTAYDSCWECLGLSEWDETKNGDDSDIPAEDRVEKDGSGSGSVSWS